MNRSKPIRNEITALISFFIVMWVPFIWLSLYNVPIGMHEWDFITDHAGTLPVTWWDQQEYFYHHIMGRYASTALLTLTSGWCTLDTFPLFFAAWHISWALLLWWCIRSMLHDFPDRVSIWVAVAIQTVYLTSLHDVYDSLYRYAGLLTYQLGALLLMLAFIFYQKWKAGEGRPAWLFAMILLFTFLCIGSNEISMLFVFLAGLVWFFTKGKSGKESQSKWIALAMVIVAGSALVLLSPGNPERLDGENGGMGFIRLLGLTAGATLFVWLDWLSSGLLVLMTILAVPFLALSLPEDRKPGLFEDYRPWLWTMILFVPASLSLVLYGSGGDAFPERVIDHVFFHVLMLGLGLIIALCIRFNWRDQIRSLSVFGLARAGYFICLGFVALFVFGKGLSVDRSGKENVDSPIALVQSGSHITNAWLTIIGGDAQQYHRESIQHLESLRHCQTDTCYMKRPSVFPVQLYDPLSDRRNRKGDRYMGYYFDQGIRMVRYEVRNSAPESPKEDLN